MNITNRYNSFNQVHKGLRAYLYDTALKLQQTDLADAKAGEAAMQQVEEVLVLFESHAHNEDEFFNRPLEETNPEVAKLFEKEHEEDHRLGQVLADLVAQWREEPDDHARAVTGRNLFYAFNEFIAFNLYHMNKEEIELNAALWNAYSDEEIIATEQTLVQQTPPAKMMKYARWMIRGCNTVELTRWLSAVKANAPAEVFFALMHLATDELPAERLRELKAKLEGCHHAAA
ncbi:MAG: hypothetical protein JNK44_04700 [Cyclobacteriaceae bacterium]|nr:hypothetical protein [Cyclobacteriaceae bacterium]